MPISKENLKIFYSELRTYNTSFFYFTGSTTELFKTLTKIKYVSIHIRLPAKDMKVPIIVFSFQSTVI